MCHQRAHPSLGREAGGRSPGFISIWRSHNVARRTSLPPSGRRDRQIIGRGCSACTRLRLRHEGVDPRLWRLDRIPACFPGIDRLAAAWRSHPRKCCNLRRTTHNLSIAVVLLLAAVGAILGSIIGFWIGDRYGYPLLLRYGSYIGLTETRIKIAQYLFRRQGGGVVLVARFVAVLGFVV